MCGPQGRKKTGFSAASAGFARFKKTLTSSFSFDSKSGKAPPRKEQSGMHGPMTAQSC
jgi:hypothetical protein